MAVCGLAGLTRMPQLGPGNGASGRHWNFPSTWSGRSPSTPALLQRLVDAGTRDPPTDRVSGVLEPGNFSKAKRGEDHVVDALTARRA
jgi:hypothetical protein